jgi:hypothetical protein
MHLNSASDGTDGKSQLANAPQNNDLEVNMIIKEFEEELLLQVKLYVLGVCEEWCTRGMLTC